MIELITIKKVASYDDTGVQISGLKKVNFFFGFNGSGKSTIAKYLNNLSLESSLRSPEFIECTQVGYVETNHQLLIFDENFTEINFNRNPVLKGVFSLNQANDIIDRQIATEEGFITEFEKSIIKKKQIKESIDLNKRQNQNALLDFCWAQRNAFTTFSKINLIHAGSKPNHLHEIKGYLQNPISGVLTATELANRYQTLYEKELRSVSQNIDPIIYKRIRHIERNLDKILQEIIVGNEDVDIAALILKINARSWVEEGVKFIDQTNGVCPFCQQNTMDEYLRDQFHNYFDLAYKEKIRKIVTLQEQYKENYSAFLSKILDIQNEFNPSNLVSNIYLSVNRYFEANYAIIASKIENPNERKRIHFLNNQKADLSDLIKSIKNNNNDFLEINNNRNIFITEVWRYMASNCQIKIKEIKERETKYQRITTLADDLIGFYDLKILSSKQEIESLRGQTVNTKDAVDNINLILKNTGFDGFEIAERNIVNNISQYFLKRHNTTSGNPIFKTLSEGEKNFISFLYFFQLCIGTDDLLTNGIKKKIIVIDDPVSSLDSQALFVVSTLIHNLILRKGDSTKPDRKFFKNENIAQVFILTHNLYFYKEVSFDKRPICTDYWHYRIIKIHNKTHVSGDYNKTIYDDYSLLWNTMKEIKANMPGNSNLNIVIANSMRRIIESYVNFIGYGKDSWSAVFTDKQDEPTYYIKCAFISTINDESHKISVLDSVYYQKIINEQPQILFGVFTEIFKTIGKEHYELMMEEQLDM